MENQDIRWIQRFQNYRKALVQLNYAVELSKVRELSKLEEQGLIQAFEFTHELAWNVMKDYFEYQGDSAIRGSRDATRAAFKMTLLMDGEGWMDMIKSRNESLHTYNEDTAEEIVEKVRALYARLFNDFEAIMENIRSGEQTSLF